MQNKHSDQFIRQWFEPLSISTKTPPNDNPEGTLFSSENNNKNAPSKNNFIQVSFPHHLFGQCFMMSARQEFENTVSKCLGTNAQIEYIFDSDSKIKSLSWATLKKETAGNKNPFSFSSFIVVEDNYFAIETAQGIARGNIAVQVCNPFCIYGKTGCGKTHLLQALISELRSHHNMPVFISTPKELIDMYQDIGSNQLARQKITFHQAFILDNFEQVKDNVELQKELVIIFDHFYTQGKTIAFGSNCLPDKIEGLIFPLLTRLQQGVFVEISQPDLELRSIFTRNKAKACNLPLSDKQVLALSAQFTGLRQLEGIISRINALSFAQGKKISNRDFDKLVREAGGISLSELTSTKIIEICSENLSVSVTDILGSKRSQKISLPRQIAMYLCRELLRSSYPELGNIFGGKDQSTAMYSVKKIEQLIKLDKDTHKLVTSLKARCLNLKK